MIVKHKQNGKVLKGWLVVMFTIIDKNKQKMEDKKEEKHTHCDNCRACRLERENEKQQEVKNDI